MNHEDDICNEAIITKIKGVSLLKNINLNDCD